MKITVEAKSYYGTTAFYPVCDNAKLFAEIAGTKTLTCRALGIIKDMGITLKVTRFVNSQEVSYEF